MGSTKAFFGQNGVRLFPRRGPITNTRENTPSRTTSAPLTAYGVWAPPRAALSPPTRQNSVDKAVQKASLCGPPNRVRCGGRPPPPLENHAPPNFAPQYVQETNPFC